MKTNKTHFLKPFWSFAIAALFFISYSCIPDTSSEDTHGDDALNAVSAKSETLRPIKAQMNFVFDFNNTLPTNIVTCVAGPPVPIGQSLMSGNVSHLGNLQPGESFPDYNIVGSYLTPISCNSTNFPVLETVYKGVYIAANGDELHTEESVFITFTDLPSTSTGIFSGTGKAVNGGTGRFANASGSWELIGGTFANGAASWEMEGVITYAKSKE